MKSLKGTFSTTKGIVVIAAFTLIIKLILFPFAQATDADAVTRTFFTIEWMQHPHWITSGIWGPFHVYLNSLALLIWDNTIYAPGLMNVFLSVLTLFPFYFFTRREFNEKGALIAAIFLAICPILFRNSFLGLSETPYLFFLVLTMNFLSKGLKENKNIYCLLAGLFITIASGFRYEAWLIAAVFGLLLLLQGKWKEAFLFGGIAMLFPLFWLIKNYHDTGNALYGISLEMNVWGVNHWRNFEAALQKVWFFPFSWMIGLGPLTAFITLKKIIEVHRNKVPQSSLRIWAGAFWIMLLFFIYSCFKGALLLQHRFTGTLIVLSLPYFALYFDIFSPQKMKVAYISVILTVGLSFAWNTPGVIPLPRLENQSGVKITELIRSEIDRNSGLILDFWSWENTYYIGLHSKLPTGNIIMIGGDQVSNLPSKKMISDLLKNHPNGIIVLRKNSKLNDEMIIKDEQLIFKGVDLPLHIKELNTENNISILKYTTLD